jgi:glycosyltransferase involved in cell wall biosynthesis
MPKFSLLIPTKNRAEILGQTLDHLLLQTFKDFECVVVDNDDTEATEECFQKRKLPSNFRHFRTGGLSMPDNWQVAVEQAAGEYLIILEDKTIIKTNLLAILNFLFTSKPDCNCITWRQCVADISKLNKEFLNIKNPKISQVLTSDLIKFASSSNWPAFSTIAPRGFNCAIHSRFARRSDFEAPAFRLCRPISPDYSIAYQYIALNDYLIHLSDSATIINAAAPSNGLEAHRKGELFKSFSKELGLNECDYYKFAPSKVFSVHNSLTSDAIRIFKEFKKTENFKISLPEYYVNISYETVFRKCLGCDIETDVRQFQQEIRLLDADVKLVTLEFLKKNHIDFCNRWGLPSVYHNALEMHISTFFK